MTHITFLNICNNTTMSSQYVEVLSNPSMWSILALLSTFIVIFYTVVKWYQNYWERRGIPYLKPTFLLGSISGDLNQSETISYTFKHFYDKLKARNHKYGGAYMFTSPIFIPIDPELVKCIMVKDFQHFVDRGIYINERDDPLTASMFALEGSRWKNLRAKLSPTFTSGKMKSMFEIVVKCSEPIEGELEVASTTKAPSNIKDMFVCYTMDVIGSCAFGLDCNSFTDKDHQFIKYGYRVVHNTTFENIKGLFLTYMPNLGRWLRMKMSKPDYEKFYKKIVAETVELRRKNGNDRKDFMQLLIQLLENELTLDEITSQAVLFLVGGFETSSTTGTFCLFELASNQNVQQKVRDEINDVLNRYDGKLTYESLHDMKYMGQVIDETLRKYPPLGFLNRICTKDYTIPGSETVLEKGTRVLISNLGLQLDADNFPEPEKFDPDRFSEENKGKIIPFTYMPFGEGPRNCIGLRFGIMQTKIGLVAVLKNYNFSLNPKTETPLKMDPNSPMLSAVGDVWLDVRKVLTD